MTVLAVTGTGTEIGKTVVTAAVAALSVAEGRTVAVVKPAQAGLDDNGCGDVDEIRRLAGVTGYEVARYPDPVAPNIGARLSGLPPVRPADVAALVGRLSASHDLVLVEGAGGLLVRYDDDGGTFADIIAACDAEVLLVTHSGLGALNWTVLTAEAMSRRGLRCVGMVIGSLPGTLDLATEHNIGELPVVSGLPLLGALPQGMAGQNREQFLRTARSSLAAELGGTWHARLAGSGISR